MYKPNENFQKGYSIHLIHFKRIPFNLQLLVILVQDSLNLSFLNQLVRAHHQYWTGHMQTRISFSVTLIA